MVYRPIEPRDRAEFVRMVTAFYASDAVLHPISIGHIEATFEELLRSDVYTEAVLFEEDDTVAGYALLAKTFSQEAGGMVVWVEELYVEPAFRGRGIGGGYLRRLLETLPPDVKRVRLEVERENEGAVRLYESLGFSFFGYDQMIRE